MSRTSSYQRRPLKVGFVALSDCAPLVLAEELGLFASHGLEVELHREVGWATIRDKIVYGELDAAQAPAGLVVSASCGLGTVQTDCLTGLVLNLHGNAITLSEKLWDCGVRNGNDLHAEIHRSNRQITLGVVHAFSSHNILLRNWLRSHRIHPERDVRIVVVPPAQIHQNLRSGHLDGYCVGEPWNSVAILAKTGWCVATSAELAPGHLEKVLMVRRQFAQEREAEHLALIGALLEACRYCDEPQHREHVIQTLSRPAYVGASINALRNNLGDSFHYGHGRIEHEPDLHIFSRGGANEPTQERAEWLIRGLHAIGIVDAPINKAADWFRRDIFQQASHLSISL